MRVHCKGVTAASVERRRADLFLASRLARVRGGGFRGIQHLPLLGEKAPPFFHPAADLFQHARQAKVFQIRSHGLEHTHDHASPMRSCCGLVRAARFAFQGRIPQFTFHPVSSM